MILLLLAAIKNPAAVCRLLRVVTALIRNAMKRIIDRTWFESKPADFVRVTATETVTGHLEVSVYRPHVWEESGPCDVDQREYSDAELEAKRQRCLESAAQRAKQRVRHACKSIGADTLMTLTYKANVDDLAKCKANLKEFARRVTRVWPEFRAVAGFERQKRGAWHVHLAVARVPASLQRRGVKVKSFDVLRAIWRDVTKANGGNVDVQRRKRNSRKSPARIASYLSKYITKAFAEGEKWSNRWTSFGGVPGPIKHALGQWSSMSEAMAFAYSLVSDVQSIVTAFVGRFGDHFFLAAEPSPCPT